MWTPRVDTVRKATVGIALVLGCLLAAAAVLVGVANRELLDAGRFSRHVDAVRLDPTVATEVGEAITAQVLRLDPDLVAYRPVIQTSATTLIGSPVFTPIVTAVARQVHAALTRPHTDQLVLRLADVGAVLVPTLRALAPDVVQALPADFDVTLARVGGQDFAGRTISAAHQIRLWSWLSPLLAVCCFVVAGVFSRDRRRALGRIGVATAVAGVLAGLVFLVASAIVAGVPTHTLDGSIVHASWHELTGPATTAVLGVVVAGALLVAAAGMRVEQSRVAAVRGLLVSRASAVLHESGRTRAGRLLRAVVLVVLGGFLVLRPVPAVRVVTVVLGLGLVVVAVAQLAAELPAPAARTAPEPKPRKTARPPWPAAVSRRQTTVLAGAVGVLLVGALVAAGARPTLGSDPPPAAALPGQTCDGYLALCDRPYDQVAFAATHNSMSAADQPGWLFAEQPDGMVAQLDAGVRALLFDAMLAEPTKRPGFAITPSAEYNQALSESNQTLGKQVVASALRVRDRLGLSPTGAAQPYLCHYLCEFGATAYEPELAKIKDWLVAHPRDVVTFIIQDEDVSTEQTDAAFQQAGLLPYVYTHRAGQAWPTLGQMIADGHRLVVFLENRDGGTRYPWEMPAFTSIQDTPFTYKSAAQFSCAPNRGETTSPLLLVNHWLSNMATRVTDSAMVNNYDVLWPRVSECRAERHHIPNFVAVDFYNEGDLFRVVDELNGLP